MKMIKLLLAGLVAASVTVPMTGCGVKQTYDLPATGDEAPTGAGTVTVTVIDHVSKPVAGATVTLADAQGAPVGTETQTDADGRATFEDVPMGSGYAVTAENGGITGSQASLSVDGVSPVVVSIMLIPINGAAGTIGGTVVDGLSGIPVQGAAVSVVGTQNTVTTQADGSFVLKDVPAGSPTVVAKIEGYREARSNVALKGGTLERVSFKLFPTGNPQRMGHTVVTTAKTVLEFDKYMNLASNYRRGAAQARTLVNGNLLMASGSGVFEVNASGNTVWTYRPLLFGRLDNPQGIDRTESGTVYVADTDNDRVIEVNQSRRVERQIKTRLKHPMGVDYIEDAHTVLIADSGNNRVIEVGPDGRIVWSVGDGTTGLVNHPAYAERLANGNTLITDTGNSRILEVDRNQRLVWMYGGKGDRSTCFLPNSAVRLPNGHTLIADSGNDRVIEVSSQNEVVWQLPGVTQPLFAERL